MTQPRPTAAVTGASGYLGSRICASLESRGWRVVRLTRSPDGGPGASLAYALEDPIGPEVEAVLHSADVLIHAAYDLSLTRRTDIWRVNVEGTRRLLEATANAGTGRILVLSSMSAFPGTTQLYGRAKRDIEAITVAQGGCAVRPGLVYSEKPAGMAGALRRLTKLPVIPVVAGGARVYTVHEDDLMVAIAALAGVDTLRPGTISVAHPASVSLPDLLKTYAAQEGHRCTLVAVPWRTVYYPLRVGEAVGMRLPFRADSLLGLVRAAPCAGDYLPLAKLGVAPRAFSLDRADPR